MAHDREGAIFVQDAFRRFSTPEGELTAAFALVEKQGDVYKATGEIIVQESCARWGNLASKTPFSATPVVISRPVNSATVESLPRLLGVIYFCQNLHSGSHYDITKETRAVILVCLCKRHLEIKVTGAPQKASIAVERCGLSRPSTPNSKPTQNFTLLDHKPAHHHG